MKMALFTPAKVTTPRARSNRGIPSNFLNFCTPSKLNHFDDQNDEAYPNSIIKSRTKFRATPATVNESPLSSAGSVGSSPNLISVSSQDDSSVSASGISKRLGFDKPTQISFDKKSGESSSQLRQKLPSFNANYVVLAFALLLLRLIWLESSAVNVNIRLSPQMTKFDNFEDYQLAPRQFVMPNAENVDHLPDTKSFKFYKLEKDASGPFLAAVEGKDLLGPPRPFSRRWMKRKSEQIMKTSTFLKEKSEIGISEVLQDDHVLI